MAGIRVQYYSLAESLCTLFRELLLRIWLSARMGSDHLQVIKLGVLLCVDVIASDFSLCRGPLLQISIRAQGHCFKFQSMQKDIASDFNSCRGPLIQISIFAKCYWLTFQFFSSPLFQISSSSDGYCLKTKAVQSPLLQVSIFAKGHCFRFESLQWATALDLSVRRWPLLQI